MTLPLSGFIRIGIAIDACHDQILPIACRSSYYALPPSPRKNQVSAPGILVARSSLSLYTSISPIPTMHVDLTVESERVDGGQGMICRVT